MERLTTILLLAFTFFLGTTIIAQPIHLEEEQVPAEVKINFEKKYPQAEDAIWEKSDNGLYSAQFWDMNNDIYINAYYEEDGTWSKTVMELSPDAFTEAIRQYMKTNHKNESITNVIATQEPNGKITYKVVIETSTQLITLFFDRYANVLEKKEENINFENTEDID